MWVCFALIGTDTLHNIYGIIRVKAVDHPLFYMLHFLLMYTALCLNWNQSRILIELYALIKFYSVYMVLLNWLYILYTNYICLSLDAICCEFVLYE